MIGTIFSVCVALFLLFNPLGQESISDTSFISIILIVISSLFILVQTLITIFSWMPLQKMEQKLTPHVIELFEEDRNLKFTNLLLLLFLVLTYLVIIDLTLFHTFNEIILLAGWTVILGISIDHVHHFLKRVMAHFNPFEVIELMGNKAEKAIRENNHRVFCHWIDSISETAVKAIENNSTSLTLKSIDEIQNHGRDYLHAAKSISHLEKGIEEVEKEADEVVSYSSFLLLQRLELIFKKALDKQIEPVCSEIITTFGKLFVFCADYDISLATYPIDYLGKCALAAQKKGLTGVSSRASITMVEISKILNEQVDLTYLELQDPFITMINYLDEIAKETFKKDKSINLQILIQPFEDLKQLFEEGTLASHQDRHVIVQNIDRVVNEFTALDEVLKTLPPLPKEDESD